MSDQATRGGGFHGTTFFSAQPADNDATESKAHRALVVAHLDLATFSTAISGSGPLPNPARWLTGNRQENIGCIRSALVLKRTGGRARPPPVIGLRTALEPRR